MHDTKSSGCMIRRTLPFSFICTAVFYAWQQHPDRWSEQTYQKHWLSYRCKPWHSTDTCREGNSLSTACYYGNASYSTIHRQKKPLQKQNDYTVMPEKKIDIGKCSSYIHQALWCNPQPDNIHFINCWSNIEVLLTANKQFLALKLFSLVNNTVWSIIYRFQIF